MRRPVTGRRVTGLSGAKALRLPVAEISLLCVSSILVIPRRPLTNQLENQSSMATEVGITYV